MPDATSCTRPAPTSCAASTPIAVEELAVANMVRNRCLAATAISRSGWGQFCALLTCQAQRYAPHPGRGGPVLPEQHDLFGVRAPARPL